MDDLRFWALYVPGAVYLIAAAYSNVKRALKRD